MRFRRLAWMTLTTIAILAPGMSARGQGYYYPAGYGGWYGWSGGETPFSANARGMGVFAAGAGAYNLNTAQAHAINVEANMRLNEYLWRSQQLRNQRYYAELARRQERTNATAESTYERLRNNPEPGDIQRGDALNVALDEVTDPRVYVESLQAASTPISSQLIRAIPFKYAPWAVTISLKDMTEKGIPEILQGDDTIGKEHQALQGVLDQAEAELSDQGTISPETLAQAQAAIKALHETVQTTIPEGPERLEADNYLKALFGLTRMLETPRFEAFLSELDNIEETDLGHLINFMNAFNLRFGVAETPDQEQAYAQLFPMLDALRDEVNPQGSNPMATGDEAAAQPSRYSPFSEMRLEDFGPQPPAFEDQTAPTPEDQATPTPEDQAAPTPEPVPDPTTTPTPSEPLTTPPGSSG